MNRLTMATAMKEAGRTSAAMTSPQAAAVNAFVGEVPPVVQPILEAACRGEPLAPALDRAVESFGFDRFIYYRRDLRAGRLGRRCNAWGSFPSVWLEARRDLFPGVDPVLRAALRSGLPFSWDATLFASKPHLREYYAAACAHGLCSGVCMVVFQPQAGHCDFFGVAAESRVIGATQARHIADHLADLWALGAYGHALLSADSLGEVGSHYERPLAGPDAERRRRRYRPVANR